MKPRYFIGGPIDSQLLDNNSVLFHHPEYFQFNSSDRGICVRRNGKKHELKCIYIHRSIIDSGLSALIQKHYNEKFGETKL